MYKKFQQNVYQNQVKNHINNFEVQFLNWYVAVFGDEWKLIADVINYHPFTKGGLRDPEELKNYYINYHETFFNQPYFKRLNITPWRTCDLPILLNQRPPSLLNSVHQQCLIHQNGLKIFNQFVKRSESIKSVSFIFNRSQNKLELVGKIYSP